ncbi:MAG: glycosyltransferase family 4 protein [Myxococcota bacterium]
MRVLHVTPYYPPTWAYGGIPRVVSGLARAQKAAGLDVRVWTTDVFDASRRSGRPRVGELDGIEVHVAPVASNRLAWAHQLYVPLGSPPMDGVDVVHLHGHRHLLNWLAFRARGRRPVVQTPNGTLPRLERKVTAKAAWDVLFDGDVPRRADRLVATSKAEVRQMLAAGIAGDRIVRIPNGLEMPEPPPRGRFRARHGIEGPMVAFLGQVTPRKGVDRLVRAMEGVPATLVVAGPPRGMSLPEGVLCTGTLEGEDRLALLVDADVLAYPSTHEIFGLVPMEGLWCGAPVVVGDDCGCGEIVAEADAGLLVDDSVEALRGAIRRLVGDRAAARAMAERGRAYVRRHLDFAGIARRHLEVYETLCATASS